MEEISFAERDSEEKEAFDIFMGDALDATSTEIVKLGVATSELVVLKIFSEVEHVRRCVSDASVGWRTAGG